MMLPLCGTHFFKRCAVCPSESLGHCDVSFHLYRALRYVDVSECRKPEHNVYNQSLKVAWLKLLISQVVLYDNGETVVFQSKHS